MKKHKSVISILLAIMMIFTFMPTLAFADSATGEFNAGHKPGAVKDGKVLVEATRTSAGIVEVGCTADGGICPHKETVKVNALGHDWVDKRFDSAAEYAAALLNAGAFANESDIPQEAASNQQKRAADWLSGAGADICYGYAKVCSVCGALDYSGENYGLTPTYHNNNGAKKCAATFTCEICGKENATNPTHRTNAATYHAKDACKVAKLAGKYCTKKFNADSHNVLNPVPVEVEAWEEITTYTCKECNQVVAMDCELKADPANYASSILEDELDHTMEQKAVKEATCEDAGTTALVCKDCGFKGVEKSSKPLGHDFSVVNSVAATTAAPAFTFNTCSRCGKFDPTSLKSSGKPLNIAYNLEVFWPKHCDAAGIVKVTRQVENTPDVVKYLTYGNGNYKWFGEDEAFTNYNHTDKDYFLGFTQGESLRDAEGVEIPDIKPTGHKWAKAAKVADATCEIAEQEAMTCTICGDIKHPTTKVGKPLGHAVEEVVVEATCGAAGYSYKICTRCNNYMEPDGKTVLGKTPAAFDLAKYGFTNPVVKLGEKCTYEWKVLEESTPFKKGTRAKVCTVCNHLEEATKESIAEKTIAAPKVKAQKKKAKVTVKAVEGAVKYQILVNGKVSKTVKKAGTFTVKKGIKASKKGKKNTFKIRAINADGVKATSKAKSVKIKK